MSTALRWIDPFKVWYSSETVTLNTANTGLFAIGRYVPGKDDGGWSTQDGEPLAVLRVVEDWRRDVYIALDNRRLLFFRCLKVMGLSHKVPVQLCENWRNVNDYYSGMQVVITDHWNVTERQFVGSLKADTSAKIGIQSHELVPQAPPKQKKAEASSSDGKSGKGSGKKKEDAEWQKLEKIMKKLNGKWHCKPTVGGGNDQNHKVSLEKGDPWSATCETKIVGKNSDEGKTKQISISDEGYIHFGTGNIILDTETVEQNKVHWYDWKRPANKWEWLRGWEKSDKQDKEKKSEGDSKKSANEPKKAAQKWKAKPAEAQ